MLLEIIPAKEAQLAFDLVFAAVLGGLIGIERESKNRTAGFLAS